MLEPNRLRTMLANEATRAQALDELGTWVKETALVGGASPSTAYVVAWVFVEGLCATWEGRRVNYWVCR